MIKDMENPFGVTSSNFQIWIQTDPYSLGEDYHWAYEIADPLTSEKVLSSRAETWVPLRSSVEPGKYYQYYMGYRYNSETKTMEQVPGFLTPHAILVVPCYVKFRVEVDGLPNEKPTLYLIRVPPKDNIRYPNLPFPQGMVKRLTPTWDSEKKKWVCDVEFLVKDFASTKITYQKLPLVDLPTAVFAVVGTTDNVHWEFDWIHLRLLPPNIRVRSPEQVSYATQLIKELLWGTKEGKPVGLFSKYNKELAELYLPHGENWQTFLWSMGFPEDISRNSVKARLMDLLAGKSEVSRLLAERLIAQMTENRAWNLEYKSWLELFVTLGKSLASELIYKLTRVAIAMEQEGFTPTDTSPETIDKLFFWTEANPPSQQTIATEEKPAFDLSAFGLFAPSTDPSPELSSWVFSALGYMRGKYINIPKALLLFQLNLNNFDPQLSFDPSDPESPHGKIAMWFIGQEERTLADGSKVVDYRPFIIQKSGDPNKPLIITEVELPNLNNDELAQAVEFYFSSLEKSLKQAAEERIRIASHSVELGIRDDMLNAAYAFGLTLAAMDLFPDYVANSDVWALYKGQSKFGPAYSPFPYLTGAYWPTMPTSWLQSIREIAGNFAEEVKKDFKMEILQDIEQAIRDLSFIGNYQALTTADARSAYAAFLLAVASSPYLALDYDPFEDSFLRYVPFLIGTKKILHYTNLKRTLSYSVMEGRRKKYFDVRSPLWENWWTRIIELETGEPVYQEPLYADLQWGWAIYDKLKKANYDYAQSLVSLSKQIVFSPDRGRAPQLYELAMSFLERAGVELKKHADLAKEIEDERRRRFALQALSFIQADPLAKARFKEGFKERYLELFGATDEDLGAEPIEEQAENAWRNLFVFVSHPDYLVNLSEALRDNLGDVPPDEWFATVFQRKHDFAYYLGREMISYQIYIPSLLDIALALDSASKKYITPDYIAELKKRLGVEEGELWDQALMAFLTETARSLTNIAIDKGATTPVLAYSPEAKAITMDIRDDVKQAISNAFSKVQEEYKVLSPWDLDRIRLVVEANLYGWLWFPASGEEFVKKKFLSPDIYFPFIGEWAHTEQRIALRVAIATGSFAVGIAAAIAALLGK